MSQASKHFMSAKIEDKVYKVLINSIRVSRNFSELSDFMDDLFTPQEKVIMAKRVAIAFLLMESKYTYDEIRKIVKVSAGTIGKVHAVLALKGEGYRKSLGTLIIKKAIKNYMAEFIYAITPNKRTLTGETYKKPTYDLKRKINEPL